MTTRYFYELLKLGLVAGLLLLLSAAFGLPEWMALVDIGLAVVVCWVALRGRRG